jgi:hypothetical protein
MIGISGLARSGKDTLAENLANIIRYEWNMDVEIFSFAEEIKNQANDLLKKYYNISAFSEDTKEKEYIRPLLVAHGECMKSFYGKNIWAETVLKKIKSRKSKIFPIISDVRFDFEAKFLQENGGRIIHISKVGNLPPNDIEAKNDPLVQKCCDITHCWPVYEPNQMSECYEHAKILWQMIQMYNNEWKTIYT